MAIAWSTGSRLGALLFQMPPIRIPSAAGSGGRAVERRHGVSGSGSVGLAVPTPEDLDDLLFGVDAVPVGHVHRVRTSLV